MKFPVGVIVLLRVSMGCIVPIVVSIGISPMSCVGEPLEGGVTDLGKVKSLFLDPENL